MGALTENLKRFYDVFSVSSTPPPTYSPVSSSPAEFHIKKKPRILLSTPIREKPSLAETHKSRISKLRSLPPPQPLPRTVHAPQRNRKFFGSANSVRKSLGSREMKNARTLGELPQEEESALQACDSPRICEKAATENNMHINAPLDSRTECLSVEEYKRLVERRVGKPLGSNRWSGDVHRQAEKAKDHPAAPCSSGALDLTLLTPETDKVGKITDYVPVNHASKRTPIYKELYESSKWRDSKLNSLEFEVRLAEEKISAFKLIDQVKEVKQDAAYQAFVPLSSAEEDSVSDALSGSDRHKLLVTHESSNIEITQGVLKCLTPGGWLNDEVINLYLELLKERERSDPEKFLKCHFFNTFFYKKLISGRSGYDYKAVRRWTTQKKLGYSLFECDKIFVPIHKDIHWCLAIINVKDEKFQYLDSLGGIDYHALEVLARYFVDEVKDKGNKDINVSSWKFEQVDELPEQENGWDCGMFMIKYADFYSRGLALCFSQEHMPYFRKRTALEILRLKAQ